MNVTVVVASRNRRADLLASLPRHEAPVILVDNGSTDGTVAAVGSALPAVQILPLGRNVGALARTVGVLAATTPYVAFADDDSWWAPGALARAVEVLEAHPAVALVTGRILLGPDERVDPLTTQKSARVMRRVLHARLLALLGRPLLFRLGTASSRVADVFPDSRCLHAQRADWFLFHKGRWSRYRRTRIQQINRIVAAEIRVKCNPGAHTGSSGFLRGLARAPERTFD